MFLFAQLHVQIDSTQYEEALQQTNATMGNETPHVSSPSSMADENMIGSSWLRLSAEDTGAVDNHFSARPPIAADARVRQNRRLLRLGNNSPMYICFPQSLQIGGTQTKEEDIGRGE